MSIDRLYLARFLTASKRQHADDLLELGREGKFLALESFWSSNELIRILEEYPEVKIFLDSGAYTLETQEVKDIQKYLDDYIDFILKYKDRLLVYVSLDDIRDVEISWKNQRYMEGRGVMPLPVYHHGEDFKWLEKCVNEYDYVGIGGVARGMTGSSNRSLFDRIFNYIAKKNLSVKIHGFGVTSFKFLVDFPWYSVDSTTWLQVAIYGKVLVPPYNIRTQQFDFRTTARTVRVSEMTLLKSTSSGEQHYTISYSPEVVERIEKYFEMIGVDPEKLKTEAAERYRANVYYYEQLLKDGAIRQSTTRKGDKAFF